MTARVLVVDDVAANAELLEQWLAAEYFDVVVAATGAEAIDICRRGRCDIVVLDVMMPGIDGFEVCRRLKSDPATAHLPVIIVTALDQPADRVRGLEAGADDFLTKPVDGLALVTRVKSLARLKTMTDDLMTRAAASQQLPFSGAMDPSLFAGKGGRLLLVEDSPASVERVTRALSADHALVVEGDPQEALFKAADGDFDLAIVSLDLSGFDGLRLCSQLRSLERTRALPILVVVNPDDNARLLRGLDLGINDYLIRPIERSEMLARVRTQVRRKRFADRLRDNVQMTLEMAVTDGLTGLHNRSYLERHLAALIQQGKERSKPLSLLVLDIDHFKGVNDSYGHGAGDDVLREFSRRLRKTVRGIDLACRLGGEEFVVVMPDTDGAMGLIVGERIRQKIAGEPFLADGTHLAITVSIGVSSLGSGKDTPESMLKRADEALYRAKREGRNRVAPAA